MSDEHKEHGKEAPADHAEQARAERFAELVSTLVADETLPPAMTPDDRELIGVATMLRAATGAMTLSSSRASSLAGQAIEAAGAAREQTPRDEPSKIATSRPHAGNDLAERRRGGLKPALPWLLTLTASAAALVLWFARPSAGPDTAASVEVASSVFKPRQRSRPADRIVGMIARDNAHLASSRIDAIYADRLEGYRSIRLSVGVGRGGTRD